VAVVKPRIRFTPYALLGILILGTGLGMGLGLLYAPGGAPSSPAATPIGTSTITCKEIIEDHLPRPRSCPGTTETVVIPNVVGESVAQAEASISQIGLHFTARQDPSQSVAPGLITFQSPSSGSAVAEGSTVGLWTSIESPAGPAPQRPGPLTIGPDGNLYVADAIGNRILQLLPGGGFEVVAGNGVKGFSGDGGAAVDAELNQPLGMAFSPSGTLYFADSGNNRIRAISPSGIITTVVGDGQQGGWVPDGTPALQAELLGPLAVTFSPSGQLYIADGMQVLRLSTDGTLSYVLGSDSDAQGSYGAGGPAVDASADGADGLAFDAAGYLYVFGFNDKSLLVVNPAGVLTFPLGPETFYARDAGDLAETPNGSVLAGDVTSLVQLSPEGARTLYDFQSGPFLGVRYFEVDGVAESSNGTIYIDTFYGNGYSNESAIAAIPPTGSATLLWSEGP